MLNKKVISIVSFILLILLKKVGKFVRRGNLEWLDVYDGTGCY